MKITTRALGATGPGDPVEPLTIERRDPLPRDVVIDVLYCGVCHSDLHGIDGENGFSFPFVPGHEFVGRVQRTGSAVTAFQEGDMVAVANIVDSCRRCDMCLAGYENYCREGVTTTYGGRDRHDGSQTAGAYSGIYVAHEDFVYALDPRLDPARSAPLMCAGITVWEPLRAWRAGPGTTVGIVGIGGLGHLAIRLAHSLGARVIAFTTSTAKAAEARALGADEVVVSTDPESMETVRGRCDLILDTVAAQHAFEPYLAALAIGGTLCTLGIFGDITVDQMSLLVGRKSIASSGSAGRRRTRELLDFAAEHGIGADVEVLPFADANLALDRLRRGDVRYRFVLDLNG